MTPSQPIVSSLWTWHRKKVCLQPLSDRKYPRTTGHVNLLWLDYFCLREVKPAFAASQGKVKTISWSVTCPDPGFNDPAAM